MNNSIDNNFSTYHKALMELIQRVFSGDVVLESTESAYDNAIKQIKGKMKFPFISIYPLPTISFDNSKNSFPSYHLGGKMFKELPTFDEYGNFTGTDENYAKNVKTLYIIIGYQVDVWGTDRKSAEDVVRELSFWFYENQELTISYYGVPLTFTFTVGNAVQDNTDLVNYENNNKIYRFTMNIELSTALFRTENYFTVKTPIIEIGYKIDENNNEEEKDDTKS